MSRHSEGAIAAPLRTGGSLRSVLVAGRSVWRAVRNRRAVSQLLNFDDAALRDIGLTRGDVVAALSMPRTVDPSCHLTALLAERKAAAATWHRERLARPRPVIPESSNRMTTGLASPAMTTPSKVTQARRKTP